jgi:hypothetical protein
LHAQARGGFVDQGAREKHAIVFVSALPDGVLHLTAPVARMNRLFHVSS